MKTFVVLFLLILVSVGFSQEMPLLNKTDINGKMSLLVPEGFKQLTEDELVKQYGMVRMPEAAYASANNDVTLTISVRSDSINNIIDYQSIKGKSAEVDLTIEKSFYKASLGAIYDKTRFLKDEVRLINDVPFMVFEFESELSGKTSNGKDIHSKQYNYIVHGFKGKRKYIVTFVCPLELKDTWQAVAQQIIGSIKI